MGVARYPSDSHPDPERGVSHSSLLHDEDRGGYGTAVQFLHFYDDVVKVKGGVDGGIVPQTTDYESRNGTSFEIADVDLHTDGLHNILDIGGPIDTECTVLQWNDEGIVIVALIVYVPHQSLDEILQCD